MLKNGYILFLVLLLSSCVDKSKQVEYVFKKFVEKETPAIEKLLADKELASWNAFAYGSDSAYQNLEMAVNDLQKHTESQPTQQTLEHYEGLYYDYIQDDRKLEFITKIRESGLIKDPTLKQELEFFYYLYLEGQLHNSTKKNLQFNKMLIEDYKRLREECKKPTPKTDSIIRSMNLSDPYEKHWTQCYVPVSQLADKIVTRARFLNKIAVEMGYKNYHHYAISSQQIDYDWLVCWFDSLEMVTRQPYLEMMNEKKALVSEKLKIPVSEVRPWHSYSSPEEKKIYQSISAKAEEKDILSTMKKYFYNIGFPMEDIIANSDFEAREGKYPHALMVRISKDDVRLLGKHDNTFWGLREGLHLFGHAAYETSVNKDLPLIITSPHIAFHEGIAMFFEHMAYNPYWLQTNLGVPLDSTINYFNADFYQHLELKLARTNLLIFKFEKVLYENPDTNLVEVWQNLYAQMRMVEYPEYYNQADWALIAQIVNGGCQFYAYQLGRVYAHQLVSKMHEEIPDLNYDYSNDMRIGRFLTEHLFQYGGSLPFDEIVQVSTGDKLSYKAYMDMFGTIAP